MALATKCPHCNTIFRVASEQLKLRGGIVRCGSCNEVFDGNAALVGMPSTALAPAPSQPSSASSASPFAPPVAPPAPAFAPAADSGAAPAARPGWSGWRWGGAPAADRSVAAPADTARPADGGDGADADQFLRADTTTSDADADVGTDVDANADVGLDVSPTAGVAQSSDFAFLSAFPPEPALRFEHLDLHLDLDLEGELELPDTDEDWMHASTTPTIPCAPASRPTAAGADAQDTGDAQDGADAGEAAQGADVPPTAEGDAAPTTASPRAPEPLVWAAAASDGADIDEPSFVKQGRRRERNSKAIRIALTLGSLILLCAALAQGVFVFRNQLAAQLPAIKPALSSLCALAGCRIDLPAQIDLITIEPGELQTLAAATFSFTTVLHNQSRAAQRWPHLELTLTEADDKPVVRRVFAPAEYLAAPADPASGVAARSEQTIKLYFTFHQAQASGYHIAVFYP